MSLVCPPPAPGVVWVAWTCRAPSDRTRPAPGVVPLDKGRYRLTITLQDNVASAHTYPHTKEGLDLPLGLEMRPLECLGNPIMTIAEVRADAVELLAQALSGNNEARGILLDRYRNYLNLLARGMIGGALRPNLDPSDLVQQTFLEAHRDLPQFHGSGEPELAAWLRQILIHNLAHQAEYHNRQKRGLKKRVSLDDLLERSSQFVNRARSQSIAVASEHAVQREQAVLLANALVQLPEDQRTALELHHLQGLSVPEVSREMDRTIVAVTGLIYRGMKALRVFLSSEC